MAHSVYVNAKATRPSIPTRILVVASNDTFMPMPLLKKIIRRWDTRIWCDVSSYM